MPYEIPDGETETIVEGGSPGDRYLIEVSEGTARFEVDPRYAHKGLRVPADTQRVFTLEESGEGIYAFADGSQATVRARRLGFNVSLFGREFLRIDGSDTRGQLPTSIDGQNVTLDQQITGQTVTLEQDIVAQSLNELTGDTARISAESVVEVNADQTQDVSDGSSVTSTITPPANEQWLIKGMRLHAPSLSSDNTFGHSFTVETEQEAVEIAHGRSNIQDPVEWASGEWVTASGSAQGSTESVHNTLLDDSNGLNVIYTNDNGAGVTQTGNRTIRFQFEVIAT